MLNERDMVNRDGTFNRAVLFRIAWMRAAAERDLDVLVAAFGPTLRLPVGISQHNVAAWRRARAAKVDRGGLRLTPYGRLLAEQLRRTWQAAHAVRAAVRAGRTPRAGEQPAARKAA